MDAERLTRREAVGRAAIAAAALALPWGDTALGARRKRPLPSIHCLPPSDRFVPVEVLGDCSFASFAPDGATLACQTPAGVELRPRGGGPSRAVAGSEFRLGSQPWHPDGGLLLLSGPGGPFAPAEAPFVVRADGGGLTRVLTDLPGLSHAAGFSPDGRRVALTYTDRFVDRLVLADFVAGDPPRVEQPRVLLPIDPATENDAERMMRGLAWHETRGFTPDGRALVFLSDRDSGMLNAGVYLLDLESGRVRHVTRDDGFAEGGVVDRAGSTVYYGSTRAREPAFATLVTGPQVPPFLGFVAARTLHDTLARAHLAPIGNGDVLAADARTGLRARIVARRETLAGAAALGVPDTEHRVTVCSLSPDGRELAVAVAAAGRSAVVIMRREAAPPPVAAGETPVPPTAARLEGGGLPLLEGSAPVLRTLPGKFAGTVRLALTGTPGSGSFEVELHGFSNDGVTAYQGRVRFDTGSGGFRHEADVRRMRGSEAGEEDAGDRGFYRAAIAVDRGGARGNMEGRSSRSGVVRAVAEGGAFLPQGRWTAGRRAPQGVAGAERCRRRRRRRRRRRKR